MKEDTIRSFFSGESGAHQLSEEVARSITHFDAVACNVTIEDMQEDFCLTRFHILLLCDAGIAGELSQEVMSTVAFAILASDRFGWDDDIISETLHDWSVPEVNLPLEPDTLKMHRNWLSGLEEPAPKPALGPTKRRGRLVLLRQKIRPEGPNIDPRKTDLARELIAKIQGKTL
jgi:hypothetical protein